MKKTTKMWALLLCGALIAPGLASANPEEKPAPAAETVTAEAPAVEKEKTGWEKFLEKLPKISGYLQSGWNYTSNANSSTSSFQAKRLRLLLDGKVGEKVDFRLQIEAFNGISGSTNGNGQKIEKRIMENTVNKPVTMHIFATEGFVKLRKCA